MWIISTSSSVILYIWYYISFPYVIFLLPYRTSILRSFPPIHSWGDAPTEPTCSTLRLLILVLYFISSWFPFTPHFLVLIFIYWTLHKTMIVSTPPTVHTPKKHPLPDSDNSLPDGTSSSRFVTPQQNTTSAYHCPQRNSPRTPIKQYNIPNMDYLRKNVNITCSNQDQILEFYIKFRLAVQKGGIHILPDIGYTYEVQTVYT